MLHGLQSHTLHNVPGEGCARSALCLLSIYLCVLAACTSAEPAQALVTVSPAATSEPAQALATMSPAATPELAKGPVPTAIPFITVAQKAPLGDGPTDPLYTLVAHADGWEELRGRLPARAFDAGSRASLSPDRLIVVAFAGMQDNSGHSVTIESITRQGDLLIISVAHSRPAPGQIVEPANTLPYHLASVLGKDLGEARSISFTFRDPQGETLVQGTVSRP